MPKQSSKQEPLPPASIIISREEIEQLLRSQIDKGQVLLTQSIGSELELRAAREESGRWSKFNRELLLRWFDNRSVVDEYERFYGGSFPMNPTLAQKVDMYRDSVRDGVSRLLSIVERLPLMPVTSTDPFAPASLSGANTEAVRKVSASRKVFVVHGHDEAHKEAVTRFVMKLKLQPVILAEEPSLGKTIIEKLEASSNVGFAVVLLTHDDVGAAKAEAKSLKPRARQNVVLELGYFVARLGRDRVCALYQSGVELPSDYHGVAYVELDAGGAWKLALAREIKAAGVNVDLNQPV